MNKVWIIWMIVFIGLVSIVNASTNLTTDLVAYYTFDETTGSDVYDAGLTGTGGILNGSIDFTRASNNYIKIQDDDASFFDNTTAPRSLSMWANLDDVANNWQDLFLDKTDSGAWGLAITGANTVSCVGYDGSWNYASNSSFSDTSGWHHFACRLNTSDVQLYIDGTLQATTAVGTLITLNAGVTLGARENDLLENYDGLIDDVNVLEIALSQEQITNIYQDGSPVNTSIEVVSTNSVYYNSMDGLYDWSGSNHGTSGGNLVQDPSGRNNSAFDFDGTDDYIETGLDPSWTDATISIWFNGSTNAHSMLEYRQDDSKYNMFFAYNSGGDDVVRWNCNANDASVAFNSNDTYSLTDWNHAVFLTNSSGNFMYLNGKIQGNSGGVCNFEDFTGTKSYFAIGRRDANEDFTGKIDEVVFYSRALNSTEITQLYEGWTIHSDDGEAPDPLVVSLENPSNESEHVINSEVNFTFMVNSSNPIQNCSLNISNSINQTLYVVSNATNTSFSLVNFTSEGNYTWNVQCYSNNVSNSSTNREVRIYEPINTTSFYVPLATNNATAWNISKSYEIEVIDTTPTVQVQTNYIANCSIGKYDLNFTAMIANDTDTACITNGAGTTSHTCTLPYSQKLTGSSEQIYISCIRKDEFEHETLLSTSGSLAIKADVITNNSFFRLEYNISEYFNATSDFLNASSLNITPNENYQMDVCLDKNGGNISGSCKTFTSGDWGNNTLITHTQVPKWYLNDSFDYRLFIGWKRVYNGSYTLWDEQTYTSNVTFNGTDNATYPGNTTSQLFSSGILRWVNAPQVYPADEAYNDPVIAGDNESFNLSIYYIGGSVSAVDVDLVYNNTRYTITNYTTSGTTRTYHAYTSTPMVSSNTNITFTWYWNVTDATGKFMYSESFQQQVDKFDLDNCTNNTDQTLMYWFNADNGTNIPSDLNATITYWKTGDNSVNYTYTYEGNDRINYTFCANTNLTIDYSLVFDDDMGVLGTSSAEDVEINLTSILNITLTYDYGNVNMSDNGTRVLESGYQDLWINFTDFNITSINYVNLTYNGTEYSASTGRVGSNWYGYYQITAPNVNAEHENVTFTWDYSLNLSTTTATGSSSGYTPVYNISIYNCSTSNASFTKSLTFYIKDFHTGLPLESGLDTTFSIYKNDSSLAEQIPFDLSTQTNYSFCRTPLFDNFYSNTVAITFDAGDTYDQATYYLYNFLWDNSTENVTIYMFHENSTANIQLQTLNERDKPIEAYIITQAYDAGTNTYLTTGIIRTDPINGVAIARLIPYEQDYRFVVQKDAVTLKSFGPMRVWQTEYLLRIRLDDYDLQFIENAEGVATSLTYDETLEQFVLVFNNPAGTDVNVTLEINEITPYGSILYYNESIKSVSGTMTASLAANHTSQYVAQVYVTNSPLVIIDQLYVTGSDLVFGKTGVFLSVIFVGTVSLIGVFNPAVAIIFALFATIISVVMSFVPMSIGGLVTLLILGGIIIFKIRK